MFKLLPVLVPIITAVGVLLIFALLFWARNSRLTAKFETLSHRMGGNPLSSETTAPLLLGRTVSGLVGGSLSGLLAQAGSDRTASQILVRVAALSTIGASMGVLLTRSPLGLLGSVPGVVPILLLRRSASKRSLLLTNQLPDALDLIGRAMRAGHSLTDSLRISALEMPAPVGIEFTRVSEENRMGRGLREALADLATRNPDNFDLRLLMSVVMLQRETGGNLVEILDNLAHTIRERGVFKEKVKALTAEVRMSAMVLTALPFLVAALLAFIQPTYMLPLIQDSLGQKLLAAAMTSIVIGVWIMRNLTQINS